MHIDKRFSDWLLKIYKSEQIGHFIIAFNFGLFESIESCW